MLTVKDRQAAVLTSFMTEINALKPGNVSRYADGHDMTVADFERSALLVSPVLCDVTLTVGERILKSVQLTMGKVGCNTNLGMILLFAPLIRAAEDVVQQTPQHLQQALKKTLTGLDVAETERVFAAIRCANPGGLGQSDEFDVHLAPECSVIEAMYAARERDHIAKQYVTAFSDIFTVGLECIKEFNKRWNRVEWSAVGCYLTFLQRFPDSHILRKHGLEVAQKIKTRAKSVAEEFFNTTNPENAQTALLVFDKELKDSNINPGTTADITAASLLVYELTK